MEMLDKILEESERAWTLWNLLEDLQQQLWDRYEDEFLEFIIQTCNTDSDKTSA